MHRITTAKELNALSERRLARMACRHKKSAFRRITREATAKLTPSMRAAMLADAETHEFRNNLPEFAKGWDMRAAFSMQFERVPAAE